MQIQIKILKEDCWALVVEGNQLMTVLVSSQIISMVLLITFRFFLRSSYVTCQLCLIHLLSYNFHYPFSQAKNFYGTLTQLAKCCRVVKLVEGKQAFLCIYLFTAKLV